PVGGRSQVSDEPRVTPEDFEEVGLDPGLLNATSGRKDFLFNTGKLMAAAAAAGPFYLAAEQAAAATKASLGGDPIATTAISAAKKNFAGASLTRISETGPQSLEPLNFSGPLWKNLVGGQVNVVQQNFGAIRTKIIAEHIAKSGALHVLDTS